MITKQQYETAREKALMFLDNAGIVLTEKERESVEVADFGLSDLENFGLQIVTYINTDYYCAKEMVLLPNQTCPEHRHPKVNNQRGKQETFRCRWGEVYLYVEGEPSSPLKAEIQKGKENAYTVFHEIVLLPGEQYTIAPDTLHWFQAGDKGAIVSEFSTRSRDESDIFTDSSIQRETEISE
jgi:D-lyxose ketol-isomerase